LAAGVTERGANEQPIVAVAGAIPQVKLTAALNPLTEEMVMVDAVVFPAVVVAAAGAALIVKSGAAPTFKV
jgi:hypothetical protein